MISCRIKGKHIENRKTKTIKHTLQNIGLFKYEEYEMTGNAYKEEKSYPCLESVPKRRNLSF